VLLVEFGRQRGELGLGVQGGVGVVGVAHPPLHQRPELLGELVLDVADLVELAALDDGLVEHVQHRAAQRLGPVQHRQDRAGDIQAALPHRRSTSRPVASVVFSVDPSTSASGCLVPSMPIPSATTQQCSAKCTPSIMMTARSSCDRSADINSARALAVPATNRCEIADPQSAVTPSSIIAAITCIPALTARASSPSRTLPAISAIATLTVSGTGIPACSGAVAEPRRGVFWYLLLTAVPRMVILVDPPEAYHQAGLRWGTATSSSTRSGATSPWWAPGRAGNARALDLPLAGVPVATPLGRTLPRRPRRIRGTRTCLASSSV